MSRISGPFSIRAAPVALAIALALGAGCGGEDEGSTAATTTAQRTFSADPAARAQPESGTVAPEGKGGGDSAARRQPRTARRLRAEALKRAQTGPAAAEPPALSGRNDHGPSRGGKKSESAGTGGPDKITKPKPKPKPKPTPTPTQGQSPDGGTYTPDSIYAVARFYCSDKQAIEFVPEDQRNREGLLQIARSLAPPGTEQAAHDGCLAGLESIGL